MRARAAATLKYAAPLPSIMRYAARRTLSSICCCTGPVEGHRQDRPHVYSRRDADQSLSETDFTEDLKTLGVPVVIMHGDDDQIVPIADSALLSATDSGYKVELNTGIAIAWDIWPILPRPERRQAL
jgi:pimeloyl-ACP methyl ester carboxylesterase